jgi:succinoglycan biosynthesis protein ExoU
MRTQPDTVTVIIAAWKAEHTVGKAVASALIQPNVTRVIVVDDCSPDRTMAAAEGADDGTGRLIVLRQERNGGPAAARNRALEHLDTDWWTILDSDDWMMPGRIAGMLSFSSDADLVADDLYQIPENDPSPPRDSLLGAGFDTPVPVSLSEFVLSNVTRRGRERKELGFIKPLIRSRFVREMGLRYDPAMRLGEDYELYCRMMAAGGRLLLVPAQGYVAVVRPNSLSGQHSAEDLRRLRDANDTLAAIPGLSRRDRAAFTSNYLSVDCRYQWCRLIEAVKRRDPIGCVRTFVRPYPVPAYLAARLWEQLVIRTTRRFRSAPAPTARSARQRG